jgi:pentatricopeptide repeat protein
MMDIYAHAKQLDKIESQFQKIDQPDRYAHAILIKVYGKCQQPERAEEVVESMIHNPLYVNPDIDMINCLLNAWADSSTTYPNSAERAFKVFQRIFDDPIFMGLHIQPTVATYSTLLKCLASSSRLVRDTGPKVEMLLDKMERRYKAGDLTCRPNTILYTVAIKACLRANDCKRAEDVLRRMEQQADLTSNSDDPVRPNIRTYAEFLLFYSKLGTPGAAERTTQIHNHMRTLSQTSDPSLKPNEYTYNIVLNGWAMSNVKNAADQMWMVYEQMVYGDNVELNKFNYTTLLVFLSRSKRPLDVQRALQLLARMQTNHGGMLHPLGKHYSMVLRGCMNVGAIDSASDVMISFIDAYISGRCRLDDEKPNAKMYSLILATWIRSGNLVDATQFLMETVRITTNRIYLLEIGLGLDTALELREALKMSLHSEKDKYVDILDSQVIPVLQSTEQQ